MKILFSKKCAEYSQPGHPESPARVISAYNYLKNKSSQFTVHSSLFIEPAPCKDKDILLAHTPRLLEEVKKGGFFDMDTPALPDIFEYAKLSAGGAIEAAMLALKNEKAFSLMRPPGHHATKNHLGGFCYFNNIAIASLKAMGSVGKIAIVDFDCHHGNGTEDIFLGKKDFLYLSLHQSPLYPGTGLSSRGNCINYPLPANTLPAEYLSALGKGLKQVAEFNPDLLAVSAGFDTYKLDPITSILLEKDTYKEIGRMLSSLGKPMFAVLEGGYSRDLPECIYQFLTGMENNQEAGL
ncbi:MAG: histone deacetylase [Nitrospirae bacterium]|nr:histone deacetylase [Nitrospirota bacterium]